jgi:hypothetical protein
MISKFLLSTPMSCASFYFITLLLFFRQNSKLQILYILHILLSTPLQNIQLKKSLLIFQVDQKTPTQTLLHLLILTYFMTHLHLNPLITMTLLPQLIHFFINFVSNQLMLVTYFYFIIFSSFYKHFFLLISTTTLVLEPL